MTPVERGFIVIFAFILLTVAVIASVRKYHNRIRVIDPALSEFDAWATGDGAWKPDLRADSFTWPQARYPASRANRRAGQ